MPMGANFGDVDNDGLLDIYLGMGSPSFASLMPHVLLRNNDGKSFVDITASSGTGELHKGHGIAFADLDRSGREDDRRADRRRRPCRQAHHAGLPAPAQQQRLDHAAVSKPRDITALGRKLPTFDTDDLT